MPGLEERVAALEQALAGLGVGDSYSPAFMTVNPDGSITFDFTGHVHAEGLDIDAGLIDDPPDEHRIRWLRASDGAAVADFQAYEDGNSPPNAATRWDLNDNWPTAADRQITQIYQMTRGTAPANPVVGAAARIGTGTTGTNTRSGGAVIIDSNNDSDFLRARGCHCFTFSSAATNIANTATAQINLASVVYDVTDVRSGVLMTPYKTMASGNTQVIQRDGLYLAHARFFGPTAGFGYDAAVRQNSVSQGSTGLSAIGTKEFTRILFCSAGDVIDVTGTNSSGAAANFTAWLMCSRIGSLSFVS